MEKATRMPNVILDLTDETKSITEVLLWCMSQAQHDGLFGQERYLEISK